MTGLRQPSAAQCREGARQIQNQGGQRGVTSAAGQTPWRAKLYLSLIAKETEAGETKKKWYI